MLVWLILGQVRTVSILWFLYRVGTTRLKWGQWKSRRLKLKYHYYLSDYYVIHSCSEDIYFVSSFFYFHVGIVKSPSTGGSLVLTSFQYHQLNVWSIPKMKIGRVRGKCYHNLQFFIHFFRLLFYPFSKIKIMSIRVNWSRYLGVDLVWFGSRPIQFAIQINDWHSYSAYHIARSSTFRR